jgi:hypothetical protein
MHSLTSSNGRLAFLAVGAKGCLLRRGPQFARQDKAGVPEQGDEPVRWCHHGPTDRGCRSFVLVGVPDGKPLIHRSLIHRSLGHRERMRDSSVFFPRQQGREANKIGSAWRHGHLRIQIEALLFAGERSLLNDSRSFA